MPLPIITIHDHNLPTNTHEYYDVTFYHTTINTLVTKQPYFVDRWISKIQHIHRHRLDNLVVGLDVEWRPNTDRYMQNPVATLQLCVGRNCLIYQIMYTPFIPDSLINFLRNPSYAFVGVGVENDVEKLNRDYGIDVCRFEDLRDLGVEKLGDKELRNAGLKVLARVFLGAEVDKPKHVTMSSWDQAWLTLDQVQYACVDAYLSFEIGRKLIFWD